MSKLGVDDDNKDRGQNKNKKTTQKKQKRHET